MDASEDIDSLTTFLMPNLEEAVSIFPDNGMNPHYNEIQPQAREWINRFSKTVYGPKMQAFMDSCNFEILGTFCYPYADKDGLRAAMDLLNIMWLYDEYTDIKNGRDAREAAVVVQHSLGNPEFDDRSWLCTVMKDFNAQHISRAGSNNASRFIDHFCTYTTLVGREAEVRELNEVLDIREYIAMRREISGVRTAFDPTEYCLNVNLAPDIYNDPVFISGYDAAMDLICWANDLYSYNMEQAKQHGSANIVTVIMKTKKLDLQAAVDFLGGYFESLVSQWYMARMALGIRPGKEYRDAVRVLDAFGDWVRGNVIWSFTTERYFGVNNDVIRKTRFVTLNKPFLWYR
ncbi:isoprenoid synthase domain-containing protein [Rhodocollybia butyracea]|uniref:Terpene synthase n=1 Tax=Rhodocollybia butyracea TaxID=206335 RepID=A0A9P5TYL9_9AGAR|nr:isoprenoid synthase domain-containing protein [Rhodocollybia butyracea]